MDISKIKLPIGIIGIVLAQAFGVIWYMAQLDSTVEENSKNLLELQSQHMEATQRVVELSEKIDKEFAELEKKDALIDNEMRTIMTDHSGFAEVLAELQKSGILPTGEKREYGSYGD